MRTFALGLLIGTWLCAALGRAALHPAEIPSPRPGSWVSDTASLLTDAERASIDRIATTVHAQNPRAAIFVVTVESTNGANHRAFASDLLDLWGPNRSLRLGIVILVARADRHAELALGEALDRGDGATKSDRIMREIIVPGMRRGAPGEALVGAARASAWEYFRLKDPAEAVAALVKQSAAGATASSASAPPVAPATEPMLERPSDSVSAPQPVVVQPIATTPVSSPRSSTVHAPTQRSSGSPLIVVVMAMGGLITVLVLIIRARGPKKCPTCRQPMQELGPAEEAPHLNPAEATEERVGSVNYVIWHCAPCGKFEKVRHGKWLSGFSGCPQCRAETRREAKRTLRSATTWSTGLIEITEHCEHCGYHHVSQRTTPQIRESHRSGSSGSRSGGGGGSRGGGRSSSGGGSSGSW